MARSKFILIDGDYGSRLDALYRQLTESLDDEAPRTAAEPHPYTALKEQYDDLKAEAEAEAEARGLAVPLEGIRRPEWRELKRKYPPRTEGSKEVIDGDQLAGVNTDDAEDDIVFESIKAWAVDAAEVVPIISSRGAFDEWAARLTEGQWQAVLAKAWEYTNGARFDPKPPPAWRTPSTD